MATAGTKPPLLTLADTRARLNVSERTVRRLIGRGELPMVRLGRLVRVDEAQLESWLAELGISPKRDGARRAERS